MAPTIGRAARVRESVIATWSLPCIICAFCGLGFLIFVKGVAQKGTVDLSLFSPVNRPRQSQ